MINLRLDFPHPIVLHVPVQHSLPTVNVYNVPKIKYKKCTKSTNNGVYNGRGGSTAV